MRRTRVRVPNGIRTRVYGPPRASKAHGLSLAETRVRGLGISWESGRYFHRKLDPGARNPTYSPLEQNVPRWALVRMTAPGLTTKPDPSVRTMTSPPVAGSLALTVWVAAMLTTAEL